MIAIESYLSYNSDQEIRVPILNTNLMELIGRTVKYARGSEDVTLTIAFDEDHIVKIYDDSLYESYVINLRNERIVV
jgi:hypothetical protein